MNDNKIANLKNVNNKKYALFWKASTNQRSPLSYLEPIRPQGVSNILEEDHPPVSYLVTELFVGQPGYTDFP